MSEKIIPECYKIYNWYVSFLSRIIDFESLLFCIWPVFHISLFPSRSICSVSRTCDPCEGHWGTLHSPQSNPDPLLRLTLRSLNTEPGLHTNICSLHKWRECIDHFRASVYLFIVDGTRHLWGQATQSQMLGDPRVVTADTDKERLRMSFHSLRFWFASVKTRWKTLDGNISSNPRRAELWGEEGSRSGICGTAGCGLHYWIRETQLFWKTLNSNRCSEKWCIL